MLSHRLAARAAVLACLLLSACNGGTGSTSRAPGTPPPGDDTTPPATARTFLIKPGSDATEKMIEAMVTAVPGDTIAFDCGFFDLTTTLQLANTEAITIKGCGKDKTLLSFRNSTQQVGILAVNVRGLTIQDLTVADTDGNGFELRAVDHGTLQRVRAIWSSGGGNQSATPITADNFGDGRLHVPCTDPATQDPRAPENKYGDVTSPDYTVSDKAGRYGIYPVSSDNILVEDSESVGASDAGIYVGQTNNTIIRNSRAAYNVFGFEIENVQGGEYHDNLAECNTGGFLVYDLDGNLRQYGDRTRMYRNVSRNNNGYNFTEGGFVSNVPPGSGMITLSYDRIDIFDNTFENNNTGGIIHASYELFPEGAGRPTEKRIDFYTEGVHIFDNTFENNNTAGIIHTSYQLFPEGAGRPTEKRIDFYSEGVHIFHNTFRNNGNGLPVATTNDIQNQDIARLLPALVGLKTAAACADPRNPTNAAACAQVAAANPQAGRANTGFRGAHIVWDGLLDPLDANCPYPTGPDGNPVPHDERGKPQLTNQEDPSCHYNKYKFNDDGTRKVPDWFASCIDDDNSFSGDSLTYANFHGTQGLEAVIAAASASTDQAGLMKVLAALPESDVANFAATFDMSPHKCVSAYGSNLPPLPPVVIPPFVPSGNIDATPTPEQVAALCNKTVPDGEVNFDATAVNCPRLDQYHLFSNPEDPTSAPNHSGGTYESQVQGLPFVLNTKLFSDYAVKYRVLFMPTGSKAIYKEASTDGPNATIIFPVGTIIAKTFSFLDNGVETPIETRLLIKRVNSAAHDSRWDGLPYAWSTDADGHRVATFTPTGGTRHVKWSYSDVDSGAAESGETDYQIPNTNQCLSCHSREDSEPGAAPIGPKVRNLNRAYRSESPLVTGQSELPIKGQNQIAWLCSHGLMLGCPSDLGLDANSQIATKLERLPVFNKPGDAGFTAGSPEDIESRARAYLEVNCMHCHNVHGFAASTGLYLEASGKPGAAYGICKHPTATGAEGSDGRHYDIYPGDALASILEFRISPKAATPSARMPPLARTVPHAEGHDLVYDWIQNVVKKDTSKYPNSDACD